MSFGGHVQDMVNRIKQNAALKNARRNKFKGGVNTSKFLKKTKTEFSFNKMSATEFAAFKKKLILEAQTTQRKKILVFVLAILLPTIISFAIFILY